MPIKTQEVFTPGTFPTHTYVERRREGFEQALSDALLTVGQVISLAGPSKSGKTVLIEQVVGRDNLIQISGAGIEHPDDIWNRILDWMDAPESVSRTTSKTESKGAELAAGGRIGVIGVASGHTDAKAKIASERGEDTTNTRGRRGQAQVVKELRNSDYVILLDDFHYMSRDLQIEVTKIIKDVVRQDVKLCTAMVRHRGDDVVRANPELRGRVRSIDLEYWKSEELQRIATMGFGVLNASVPGDYVKAFSVESAGSPQLMQQICLAACLTSRILEKRDAAQHIPKDFETMNKILAQTSANTDFRSLVDVLDSGAKTRGEPRKEHKFDDGTSGDTYRAVLKAIARNPPRLSFDYEELSKRVSAICKGDGPSGSSVITTCEQLKKLAEEKMPAERAIDWDEQKQILDIPDPYLLFYLRWSNRLRET